MSRDLFDDVHDTMLGFLALALFFAAAALEGAGHDGKRYQGAVPKLPGPQCRLPRKDGGRRVEVRPVGRISSGAGGLPREGGGGLQARGSGDGLQTREQAPQCKTPYQFGAAQEKVKGEKNMKRENAWDGVCFLCGRDGTEDPLDFHHIFGGNAADRKKCERYGLKVRLCHGRCHIFGPEAAHNCAETMRTLRRYGQRKVMIEQGWTVDEFRFQFGKNYLDDEELAEIAAIQAESA